jgi:hypothetical protein
MKNQKDLLAQLFARRAQQSAPMNEDEQYSDLEAPEVPLEEAAEEPSLREQMNEEPLSGAPAEEEELEEGDPDMLAQALSQDGMGSPLRRAVLKLLNGNKDRMKG